jgi:hypothetical protein
MKKLTIGFKEDYSTDGKIVFFIETKEGNNTHIRLYSLNPLTYIKHWYHKISWFFIQKYYQLKKEEYKICEGCGEGISIYRIKDPNHGYYTRKKFNCCNHCWLFYDRHCSARKIIGWKTILLYDEKPLIESEIKHEPILEKKKRMTKKESKEIDSFLDKILGDGL